MFDCQTFNELNSALFIKWLSKLMLWVLGNKNYSLILITWTCDKSVIAWLLRILSDISVLTSGLVTKNSSLGFALCAIFRDSTRAYTDIILESILRYLQSISNCTIGNYYTIRSLTFLFFTSVIIIKPKLGTQKQKNWCHYVYN